MTTATFYDQDGALELEVAGHAGFDESGKDLVCAACSILAQSLAAAATALSGVESGYAEASGFARLTCEKTRRTAGMFDVAKAGYRMLAEAYPGHVRVRDARRGPAEQAGERSRGAGGEGGGI